MIAFNNDYLNQPRTVTKSADGDTLELYGKYPYPVESARGTNVVLKMTPPPGSPVYGDSVFNHGTSPRKHPAITERRHRRLSSIFAIDAQGRVKTWMPAIVVLVLMIVLLGFCFFWGMR